MPETEVSLKINHRDRLIVPYTTDVRPQVVLPQKLVVLGGLVVAKDLTTVPPPRIALAREQRIRHMAISPDEVTAFYFSQPSTDKAEPLHDEQIGIDDNHPPTNFSPSGILLMTGLDLASGEDAQRRTDRQLQRLKQYKQLTTIIDALETNQEDTLPLDVADTLSDGSDDSPNVGRRSVLLAERPEDIQSEEDVLNREQSKQKLLPLFQRIEDSWYKNELSTEPLTRIAAEAINQSRLPDTQAVLAGAEAHLQNNSFNFDGIYSLVTEHLRKISFNLDDIYGEVGRILHPSGKKPEVFEAKVKEKEKNPEQKPGAASEAAVELGENAVEIVKTYMLRESGVLYVHDPVKDEPSKEAGKYVEALLERPF